MLLRDVQAGDVGAYVRMRCDPVMMAELGGPLPRDGIEDKVARDVRDAVSGTALIKMITPDAADPATVAGSVVLWHSARNRERISEIGWMVLPEFQGRGLAKQAVRLLLSLARQHGGWGLVHAFPGVTNGPSNGVCRSLGFSLSGEEDVEFVGHAFRANHWVIDPGSDPAQ